MRLVKRSVNQDDVRAYHLFYADAVGTPGTDLTFFDWSVPPETRGTSGIVRTHLRVNGSDSLEWWADRLSEYGHLRTEACGSETGGRRSTSKTLRGSGLRSWMTGGSAISRFLGRVVRYRSSISYVGSGRS